ncbi:FecR family protein [Sphingomonas sp. LB-2]|uniref:FecR family protein n=1 Tax=Sphingomonas caeni TaxID=2984949 RepID=UPI002232C7F5|nr:FecR family protein [Sphingomonas caeni]MCW3849467.1 FecR family protein [Sphingomonas caeni]
MTRHFLRLALLAGVALAASPAAAQNVGVTAAVINDVRMTTQANATLHKAAVRERVALGNDVLTGKSSRAQILLLDRTTFTVGANARLRIDRFVYDPQRNSSSVGATVGRGAFRFMSGRPTHNAPGQSNIRTPTASIGIRGTMIDGVVGEDAIAIAMGQPGLPAFDADPETATLILLRGPGVATADEPMGAIDVTAGGKTVSMEGSGWAVFIPRPGAEPIGPFRIAPEPARMLASLLLDPGPGGDAPLNPGFVNKAWPGGEAPVRQLPATRGGVGVDPVNPAGGPAGGQTPAIPPRI